MMIGMAIARRIPEDELAEMWFGFKHQTLDKLQVKRRELGLQEKDIAARIGKNEATISRCFTGRTNMTMRTMHDLARGMGCRLRIELDDLAKITPLNRARGTTWNPDRAISYENPPVTPRSNTSIVTP